MSDDHTDLCSVFQDAQASPGSYASPSLIARLSQEMAARWRRGDSAHVEEFLARHPELAERPAEAAELIYEEICLRQERGEVVNTDDILQRFPQWRDHLVLLVDCARVLDPGPLSVRWPGAGETLGGFQLLTELGRGAIGRVYLAIQKHLADRPVVLKVTPNDGREHLALARLQHTHIMPLYSIQEGAERGLRVLCMPYFGGTTLDRVLEQLRGRPVPSRKGSDILESLDRAPLIAAVSMPSPGPARQFLTSATYVNAVCSIGACLADALHYAHSHSLLHLDLKPSNVLITFGGQPMLLDFHLAREPLEPGALTADCLGGTVGYMSPEQQVAVRAVQAGRCVPRAVDRRSDIYSLGLILYQSLGGPVPLAGGQPPRLDTLNPQVSKGLGDLIAKCIAENPEDRYADAASLGADLRRHLADLPLRGVANRSHMERWRKWRRRRPHAFPLGVMAAAVLAAATAVALIARSNLEQRKVQARAALDEGIRSLGDRRYANAQVTFNRALAIARTLPGSRDLKAQIAQYRHRAAQSQLADELHRLSDQIRFLYALDIAQPDRLRAVEASCGDFWQKHELIVKRLGSDPRAEFADQVRTDLLDVAILWSDLHVRLAAPGDVASARQEALRVLDEAESAGPVSAVLLLERKRHAESLGLTDVARAAADRARELAARTPWEHYALGRILLRDGDLQSAAREFDEATSLQPEGLWPNFYAGVCAYRLGNHEDAVVAFTTSISAAPQLAGTFYNRALAYTAIGRRDRALRDLDRALELEPNLTEAAFARGTLYFAEKRYAEATADLERALAYGANPATVLFNLALIHLAQNDQAAAEASLEASLRYDPNYSDARNLHDRLLASH